MRLLPASSSAASEATRLVVRLCVLASLLLLVAALYHWLAPVQLRGENGVAFRCGSAFDPADGAFAEGVCGSVTDREQAKALALLVAALLTAAAAPLLPAGRSIPSAPPAEATPALGQPRD